MPIWNGESFLQRNKRLCIWVIKFAIKIWIMDAGRWINLAKLVVFMRWDSEEVGCSKDARFIVNEQGYFVYVKFQNNYTNSFFLFWYLSEIGKIRCCNLSHFDERHTPRIPCSVVDESERQYFLIFPTTLHNIKVAYK